MRLYGDIIKAWLSRRSCLGALNGRILHKGWAPMVCSFKYQINMTRHYYSWKSWWLLYPYEREDRWIQHEVFDHKDWYLVIIHLLILLCVIYYDVECAFNLPYSTLLCLENDDSHSSISFVAAFTLHILANENRWNNWQWEICHIYCLFF